MIDFDIEFVLLIGLVVTGLLKLTARLINIPRPKWLFSIAQSLFPIFLIVFVIRGFIIEPYRIPSGSMLPTLYVGDFIAVNKFTYGIKLPVFHTEIMPINKPQRGDVVVFRFPEDPSKDYIKRLVGLPGDIVVYYDQTLYINGKVAAQSGERVFKQPTFERHGVTIDYHDEQLGDAKHGIITLPDRPEASQDWIVPEGHYFVMGDNRDFSNDSRFWGFVPEANVAGKAFMIWMSWDYDAAEIRSERVGKDIE